MRRGVLGFVENDEGIGQRAAAHESQRGDFDDAGFKVLFHLVGREHIVERIIERAQIGIDFLAHVAGQEAQALASFDRGARKNDAFDDAAFEALGGVGDGEICFAGARGADAEDEIGLVESADVGALGERAGFHNTAAGGNLRLAVARWRDVFLTRVTDEALEIAGADCFARRARAYRPPRARRGRACRRVRGL